ncbi:MAG: AarF/UbiB family protein, partial [Salaquimonas sp.]
KLMQFFAPSRIRRSNFAAFLDEFRRYSIAELNFRNEAKIMDRFRNSLKGEKGIIIPNCYLDQSSDRVLTMDWVEGMRLEEAANTLPKKQKKVLVDSLMSMLLKMFVSNGLFHADLHPGNIVFHKDGSFTLLDFGMYGELSSTQRDHFVLYWLAVAQHQTRRAFHHFSVQTEALPKSDLLGFRARFESLAETFYSSPSREVSLARVYLEMMQAGYNSGFIFPASLMLHAKALTTAEALFFVLVPDARFDDLSRPFISREAALRFASVNPIMRATQIIPELFLLGTLPPADAIDREWDHSATRTMSSEVLLALTSGGQGIGRSALTTLFTQFARLHFKEETDEIITEAWSIYAELERDVPLAQNTGAILTTHLAALTLALHRTLMQRGWSETESQKQIYKLGWDIYQRMAELPIELAKTITSSPEKRMRIATDAFRRFPFGTPAYAWRDVATDADIVGFDCTKCPVAEFFSNHDASDLCTATWCELDFPLAEKWGGRLERSKTIAGGHDHCDFRWHLAPSIAQAKKSS